MEDLNNKIEETIRNVKEACEVLDVIDYLNSPKIDLYYSSLFSSFSRRENTLISSSIKLFEIEYRDRISNSDALQNDYVEDCLTIYFVIRDIIENLEILFFMLLDTDKFVSNVSNSANQYRRRLDMLRGKIKMKKYGIKFNNTSEKTELEEELFNKYKEDILKNDFKKVKKIKIDCNNIIHKNGITNINPFAQNYYEFMLQRYSDLLFICKFNFKLFFLLRGHIIASLDYIDALELGLEPELESQYWVPDIFINYIKTQFSDDEKNWLLEHNNYDMRIDNIF